MRRQALIIALRYLCGIQCLLSGIAIACDINTAAAANWLVFVEGVLEASLPLTAVCLWTLDSSRSDLLHPAAIRKDEIGLT
jgi:hypothetical protein